MNCPNCKENGLEVEMETVEGVVFKTTTPEQDDKFEMFFECPNCHLQEDYTEIESEMDEYNHYINPEEVSDYELAIV